MFAHIDELLSFQMENGADIEALIDPVFYFKRSQEVESEGMFQPFAYFITVVLVLLT